MKRHRRDYEMMADMNLTNLLDTAFVLLIAFIMASPTMRTGLKIDLPKVEQADVINTPPESKPITISIQKAPLEGQEELIKVDGDHRVSLVNNSPDSLADYIQVKQQLSPSQKVEVVIEMDREAHYDALAKVLSVLRSKGIEGVGLPMIPDTSEAGAATPKSTARKK